MLSPPLVPHTMLVPQTMLSPPFVPHTMLSPPFVPHTMLSPPLVPQTLLSPPLVPHTMLSPPLLPVTLLVPQPLLSSALAVRTRSAPHTRLVDQAFADGLMKPPDTMWLPHIRCLLQVLLTVTLVRPFLL